MVSVLTVLLWGAETWAITEVYIERMNLFHHRSIPRNLKIKMSQVQEERITNEAIRKMGKSIN